MNDPILKKHIEEELDQVINKFCYAAWDLIRLNNDVYDYPINKTKEYIKTGLKKQLIIEN